MKKLMLMLGVVVALLATSCIKGPTGGGTSSNTFYGKLTVKNSDNETIYSDSKATLVVTIPDILEMNLTLLFKGVKFSEMMPLAINMELKDIPFDFTVSEDGTTRNFLFDAQNIKPTDYEEYNIDRVWGCVGKEIDVQFTLERKSEHYHVYFKAGDTTSESTL